MSKNRSSRRKIISYQAITGNNNIDYDDDIEILIISYQAITGNNNKGLILGAF